MSGKKKRTTGNNRLDFIDPNQAEVIKHPEEYGIVKGSGAQSARVMYTPQEQLQRLNYWLQGMTKGQPTGELIAGFMRDFNAKSKQVCMYWRNRALEYLSSTQDKDIDHFRSLQSERLTDLYRRCLEEGQLKTAESVLDTLNKLMGAYKQDNIIVAPITQFNFGDEKLTLADDTGGQAENIINYFTTGELEEEEDV